MLFTFKPYTVTYRPVKLSSVTPRFRNRTHDLPLAVASEGELIKGLLTYYNAPLDNRTFLSTTFSVKTASLETCVHSTLNLVENRNISLTK